LVAAGIGAFCYPAFGIRGHSFALASHTSEHNNLRKFKGQRVVVVGAGQSALESAALLKDAEIQVEVIARTKTLKLGGATSKIASSSLISKMLYSTRDVGPAGISRLVAMPHLFRRFPRRSRLVPPTARSGRLALAAAIADCGDCPSHWV